MDFLYYKRSMAIFLYTILFDAYDISIFVLMMQKILENFIYIIYLSIEYVYKSPIANHYFAHFSIY